jgi:hypothetical protein
MGFAEAEASVIVEFVACGVAGPLLRRKRQSRNYAMNPLLKRLATLRRKVRFLDGWLGICALVALILGVAVTVGVIDFWIHLPSLVRAVLLVGLLVGSAFIAYRYLLQPFAKPCDDLNLALRIEEVYPELNDSLASTVQFLHQPQDEQARVGGSAAMRERTVQEAIQKADQCDFSRILDRRAAVLFGAGACCILLIAALVAGANRPYARIAFWRFVEPFGMHTWTKISVARLAPLEMLEQQDEDNKWKKIEPKDTDRVAKGRPYRIMVNLEGQMPRKPEAKVEIVGQIRSDKMVPLKLSADKQSASFETAIDMTQHPQKFKFRILANDGAFPPRSGTWHEVEVLPPPKLVGPPDITVYPPAYTGLKSPELLEAGTGLVKVYAGSTVKLRARADRPLKEAWIEYRPEVEKLVPASVLTVLGQTDTLPLLAQLAGGHAVWGRIPAKFESDMLTFDITFKPWISGKFVLHLHDPDQLDSPDLLTDLTVLIDPVPEVKLINPRTSLTVLPTASIPFKFLVTDEQFAIKSVFIQHQNKGPGGELLDDAKRVVLYDAKDYGWLLPNLSARLGKTPIPGAHPLMNKAPVQAPDFRLRYKKLDVDMVWSLRNQFREGDLVVIEVCADDFCDIYSTRGPGRGTPIELRIISKGQMLRQVDRDEADIIKQLQTIVKFEEKSRDTVNNTKKQDKIDQKVKDEFTDNAEGPQREVRDRVESLRRDLKDLRQMLKDNNLTGERSYKEAGMIQGTLESIAGQELPQITPKLAEVSNDLAKNDKNTPQTKKKLDEAGKLQGSVVKSLNELINKLNPEAKMQEIRNTVSDLKEKETELNQKLEDINASKQEFDKLNLGPKEKAIFDKDLKEKINQQRQEQLDLANQTDKLIKEMKAAKDEYEKNGDKKNAKKLDQAIKEALQQEQKKIEPEAPKKEKDKTPINAQMKEVAEKLKNKNEVPQEALQQQKDILKNLDKILAGLEGRNENALNEEIKERKDVEKKIDDIAKELDKLREKNKKVQMIEDKEERLKEKQKLADAHEQLQEKIEETRRELARLNEQRAADDLKQAADKLDKAGQDLKQDGDPGPAQQQAKEELDKAKEELKKAQEELARELLVKMADQLEGLKIRQVASLERSESLHAKIIQRKSWTEPFLDTMEGNMEAQKGIAEETDNLKEKLKEAKVFHSILEKAKKSMDDAGKTMEIRRDEGKERRYLEVGEMMNAKELKDEVDWQTDTVKHQKQAARRLDNLLESIKEEIAKKNAKKEKEKDQAKQDPKKDEGKEPDGGMRPQDGIPSKAQLKALLAEQLDLNERTEDFAKRNPDLKNPEDAKELNEIAREQREIQELFLQITAPPPDQKEQPEGKEGAKK